MKDTKDIDQKWLRRRVRDLLMREKPELKTGPASVRRLVYKVVGQLGNVPDTEDDAVAFTCVDRLKHETTFHNNVELNGTGELIMPVDGSFFTPGLPEDSDLHEHLFVVVKDGELVGRGPWMPPVGSGTVSMKTYREGLRDETGRRMFDRMQDLRFEWDVDNRTFRRMEATDDL